MIEGGATTHTITAAGDPNTTPGKVPIVKRRRRGEGVDGADMDYTNEVASEIEDR